ERAARARAQARLLARCRRARRDPREAVGGRGAVGRGDGGDAAVEPARAGRAGGRGRRAAGGPRGLRGGSADAGLGLARSAADVRAPRRGRWAPVVDGAVAVAVALLVVGVVGDSDAAQPWRAIGFVTALAQGGALWWRRTRPELVMAITLAGGVIVQLVASDGI